MPHGQTKTLLIPLALFLASVLLRLALISKGPYHLDCLTMVLSAETTLATGKLNYLHSHGFPLSAILAAGFTFIFRLFQIDDAVRAVNMMSVVFASLSVPVFYAVVRRLTRSCLAAGLAAGLFSISPICLGISVFGNTHPVALFFVLAGIYNLCGFRENGRSWQLASGTLLLGLAAASRIQDVVVLVPALILLLKQPHNSAPRRKHTHCPIIVLLGGMALIAVLFYLPVLKNFVSQRSLSHFLDYEIISRLAGRRIDYLLYNLSYLHKNFSLLGFIVAGAGGLLLWHAQRPLLTVLAVWALFPLLTFSLLDFTMPRFMLVATLPLYLLHGWLFASLIKRRRFFQINAVLVLLILVTITIHQALPPVLFRHRHALAPDYFRWMDQLVRPGSYGIVGDDGKFMVRYSRLKNLPRPRMVHRPYTREELTSFKMSIDQVLLAGNNVYITDIGLFSHDPDLQFIDFVLESYQVIPQGQRLYEDWHRGTLVNSVFPQTFYLMIPK